MAGAGEEKQDLPDYDPRERLSPRSRRFMHAVGQAHLELLEEEQAKVREQARPKSDRLERSRDDDRYRRSARALTGAAGPAMVLLAMRAASMQAMTKRREANPSAAPALRTLGDGVREAVAESVRRAHGSLESLRARKAR
jgi:hypothetical protein